MLKVNKLRSINISSKLYFQRWSNHSFAIFHSIGKEVIIGVVSRILGILNTVKSITSNTLLDQKAISSSEEAMSNELFEADSPDVSFFERVLGLLFIHNSRVAPFSDSVRIFAPEYKNCIKALIGPFLFSQIKNPNNNY